MGQFQSFADILEERLEKKIRKEIEAEYAVKAQFSSENSQNTDSQPQSFEPDVISLLLGRIHQTKIPQTGKASLYHRHRPAKRPAPPPPPPHKLTAAQEKAYSQFVSWGHRLADNFSQAELKSVFRKLALKFHPDQGGKSETFMQLQECFRTLNEVFA